MAESQPFVIWAMLEVKPEAFDEFRKVALEDAADSVAKEKDCLQFNVLVPIGRKDRIALFEVYTSKQAFDVHMQTPHFKKFVAAAETATTGKDVTELYLTGGAAKPFQS
jgi:quinol monooxygenase YgiN